MRAAAGRYAFRNPEIPERRSHRERRITVAHPAPLARARTVERRWRRIWRRRAASEDSPVAIGGWVA
jgi:hypothetical protein